jgi:hypothetical protein
MVVLNARPWQNGADTYQGALAAYRRYLVNHELGHALGNGYDPCPGPGEPGPVMLQQTKDLHCRRPNPWPSVSE